MKRSVFEERLLEATAQVLTFTRTLVTDELPDGVLYLVRPNSSYDGIPLVEDEEVFPEDSLPKGQERLPPMDAKGVADFLWRHGGKVPEWIDTYVDRVDTEHTFVLLRCCGRFTAGSCLRPNQYPPFRILGPPWPQRFAFDTSVHTLKERLMKYGKFRLSDAGR